jgi:flagellar FliL protein
MAAKAKAKDSPDKRDDEDGEGDAKDAGDKKPGLAARILGPVLALPQLLNPLAILKLPLKMKLLVGAGTLVVLVLAGGAYYFLKPGPSPEKAEELAAVQNVQTAPANLPAKEAAFFDIPDIIVNLQTPDMSQAYLKLSLSLELEKAELKASIEPVLPRVIDQFQSYLRELRVEDVRGSAGVMRLKEELLRRVNLAVAPTPVRDVLLKEMIVQ